MRAPATAGALVRFLSFQVGMEEQGKVAGLIRFLGAGLYHIQSATNTFDPTELGGCALGISDTTELA